MSEHKVREREQGAQGAFLFMCETPVRKQPFHGFECRVLETDEAGNVVRATTEVGVDDEEAEAAWQAHLSSYEAEHGVETSETGQDSSAVDMAEELQRLAAMAAKPKGK